MTNSKNITLTVTKEGVKMPQRSTTGSAGFDIFAPEEIAIPAKSEVTVELPIEFSGDTNDAMVRVFVRSSYGIKKKVRIVVDGNKASLGKTFDITQNKHVVTLLNDSDVDLVIPKDEHFAQLILSDKAPSEEKQKIEVLTKEELGNVVPTKGHMEVLRPDVYEYVLDEKIVLAPHEQITLPTGIRTVIEQGTWTAIEPHESVRDKVMLANQKPVIDADYAYNDSTKGNCFLGIVNLTNEEVILPIGTKLTTWHTEKYYTFENEIKTDAVRTGGIGHTTK